MESEVKSLINMLSIKNATKVRFHETFKLMLDTEDKQYCSIFRNELQGMLNALELEEHISKIEHSRLSEAFGTIWKRKVRAFYFTDKAINKAQVTA